MADTPGPAIEIREAEPRDGAALVAAIEQIDRETDFLGEPGERLPWADTAAGQLRRFREEGSAAYFIARRQGEVIGYLGAYAGWFVRNRGVVFIAHVGLREGWRGQGIGERLFAAIEHWASARGAHRLELRVDEANARGLALYRRRGFAIEGKLIDAFLVEGAWRSHFMMGRQLGAAMRPKAEPLDIAPPYPPRSIDGLVVRRLRPGDGAALQRFEQALIGEPLTSGLFLKTPVEIWSDPTRFEADITETLAYPGCLVLVAVDRGGNILGHARAWIERMRRLSHEAFCAVSVLHDWSGAGIGRRLAAELERWSRERGLHRISTAVQANNRRGLRFAERLGYTVEAVMVDYAIIDAWAVDRLRLGKLLTV